MSTELHVTDVFARAKKRTSIVIERIFLSPFLHRRSVNSTSSKKTSTLETKERGVPDMH